MSTRHALLHHYFEHAARRWPTQVALEIPPVEGGVRQLLRYAELNQCADALAAALSAYVGLESVVAIALPRTSPMLFASQLGVLKVGAAYTCIDPVFPDEQLRHILADAHAVAVLTDAAGAARMRRIGIEEARIIIAAEVPQGVAPPPAPTWLSGESLAYLIYTSGTTGTPKGVMIEHRSIVNLVDADVDSFDLHTDDRVAQGSSPSYDSSIEETWLAWAVGATVVVLCDDTLRLGPDLVTWLRDERISVLCPPPTLLRTMSCAQPETELPDLRLLYVGGEALPRDVADSWAAGRRMVNGYGPTECSITCLRADVVPGRQIAIGRPIGGVTAWVIDEAMNALADGQQGELCLGGIALARGYRHRTELTELKFPQHPQLGRIYRTGDLVERNADGNFLYHGRIDAQVKLRGYRIELEAIEARLAACAGVSSAACHVQQDGAAQSLVAFIVPTATEAPPGFANLEQQLAQVLPAYMVPRRWGLLAELPTTIGGKIDRKRLPRLSGGNAEQTREFVAPRTPYEARVVEAFQSVLSDHSAISIDDEFFGALSGDSLTAAMVISLLRDDPLTDSVTVRDLYVATTAKRLAERLQARGATAPVIGDTLPVVERATGHPVFATLAQGLWLWLGVMLASLAIYATGFVLLPMLYAQLGIIALLLLAPFIYLLGMVVYTFAISTLLVLVKRLLIGTYTATQAPVWGSLFVRHWMVRQFARLVPWQMLEGSVFQQQILRALGATIGERVYLHRGVGLADGGWDLLDIGDDVCIGQEAALRLFELKAGQIVFGPIRLAAGATLETRAGMDPGTSMGADSTLTALSSLSSGMRIPDGECWSGVPARPRGRSAAPPALPTGTKVLSPLHFSSLLLLARAAVLLMLALPIELFLIGAGWLVIGDTQQLAARMQSNALATDVLIFAAVTAMLSLPIMLITKVLLMRALGPVSAGVISCREIAWLRVLLKVDLLQSAGDWLSGTLFWPWWLRTAGMRVGQGCEISTIVDVIPELVDIGDESFFADGVYLGGARLQRGIATLAPVRLGKNTFLGNHVVIAAGQQLPDGILLGVATVADDAIMPQGSAWFGHPPFVLARREVVEMDRRLTHEPSWICYLNRLTWESGRLLLVILPAIATLLWIEMVMRAEVNFSTPVFLLIMLPLINLGWMLLFPLIVLIMKWLLLGRVKAGQHGLWSCWCSRWDFHYVMWNVYGRATLTALEGTLLLSVFLRLMGMRIGRHVVLGGGFAQVVDPDMLTFEDNTTVNAPLFQAHTFEDRVLKIDHVRIRQGASVGSRTVMLYGADIGERAQVAAESVVMKRERLMHDRAYAGAPTQPVAGNT